MSKHIARLTTICMVGAFAFAPTALAGKYPVPKTHGGGGGSKSGAKGAGKGIQSHTGKQLAQHGVKVKVHFTGGGGTITITVSEHGKKIGGCTKTLNHTGKATCHIRFNAFGKSWIQSHAGAKVKIKAVYKPKHGKTQTSVTFVRLG